MKKLSVQVIENGPIKISNFESLKYCGELIEADGDVYLCRCGESKKPPFCDGSHSKVGFSGENEIENPIAVREWKGSHIETAFNANLCMHAGFCKPLQKLRAEEEASADPLAAEKIAKVVALCPSGALTYRMLDGSKHDAFKENSEVKIMEGGEIRISCEFEGVELQGNQPKNRLALCRCGLSKNKPHCDASHAKKDGFR